MEQSAKGMIEDVPEKMLPAGGVHYIPHHAVITRDKKQLNCALFLNHRQKQRVYH